MSFINSIIEQAQEDPRKILLPEPEDERTLKAADEIVERGIASITLIGDTEVVHEKLKDLGIKREFEIIEPYKSDHIEMFTEELYGMRKAKGMTFEQAGIMMREPIPHAIMMLHKGMGDGLVAGATHSTGDTLRPALQILRTAPGASIVSSVMFMTLGEETHIFADCALVENPNAGQLAEIAVLSAETAMSFGIEPTVAMLSYSTKGSACSPMTQKVIEATKIAQDMAKERFGENSPVKIDGELQGDAALTERVGSSKAPDSDVAGNARVLIFPDINAGNISYKLVHYLGDTAAYGPIIQGLRLPANDLSRGCTVEDIVGVVAVTVVQSRQ